METIYLDELFLLNLAIDYFLLLGTAKICALPFHRPRFAASAAIGAAWCCAALLPGAAFLQKPLMHLVLAAAMILIAFGDAAKLWRCCASFMGISALFGGAVYAAGLYQGRNENTGALIHIDMRILVLSFALCWALVSLVFRRSVKNAQRRIRSVTLVKDGRSVSFQALEDTGNGLFDPISGEPALVAEAAVIEPLFPKSCAPLLHGSAVDAMGHLPGMRLIPYAGVGDAKGLLLAFKPDSVTVDGCIRRDIMAAISPAVLGEDNSYQAVI